MRRGIFTSISTAVGLAVFRLISPTGVWAQFCPGADANSPDPKIDTAIGCIPVRVESLVPWVLSWAFGIMGGIAFLLMIYGFISVATSGGDPKAVQGARETITSAIEGLAVAIFSLFILRLVMLQILHIPGVN